VPAPRGLLVRAAACLIDGAALLALTLFLGQLVGRFFSSRAAVMLRIGQPDTFWKGPLPMLIGMAGAFWFTIPFAALVLGAAEAVYGAGLGKALLSLRIRSADGSRAGGGRLFLRALLKYLPALAVALGILLQLPELALASLAAAAVTLLGFTLCLSPPRGALHDLIARTRVFGDGPRSPPAGY